ncbi:MAG: hypothetical protein ACREMB_05245, partial [Candidatus Rokuibacteriota bacterium]
DLRDGEHEDRDQGQDEDDVDDALDHVAEHAYEWSVSGRTADVERTVTAQNIYVRDLDRK